MNNERLNSLEWLKALGMLVIIYGHTNGHSLFNPTLPVNFKQIGVVFFVFATGVLLANEIRPWKRVFYNRLFELFLFGILFSVLMSFVRLYQVGDPNESNFLPFILGLNVFVNAFPANPSLWYIGTYIHLLIAWALILRHLRIRLWMFLAVVPIEIAIRAMLMKNAGDYIAYQVLTGWASVLLLGVYFGQRSPDDRLEGSGSNPTPYIVGLAIVIAGWMWVTGSLGVTESNPFGRIQLGNDSVQLIATSTSVSLVYLLWAVLGFQIFRRLRAGPIVKFFGRNSMICFIIHMPLIYLISGSLYQVPGIDSSGILRLVANLLVFYVGTCVLSEWLRRIIKPVEIRNDIENRFLSLLARNNRSND